MTLQQIKDEPAFLTKAEDALSQSVCKKRIKIRDEGVDQATCVTTDFSTTSDFQFGTPTEHEGGGLWVNFKVTGRAEVGYRLLTGDDNEATSTEDIVCEGYMDIILPLGDLSAAAAADGCSCGVPMEQLTVKNS